MYHVIALGELLIDFTSSGVSSSGMRIFEQNPGGAPANVLAALSKFGLKTGFVGKVGDDMHGAFLKRTLEEQGINTNGLIVDPNVFTTLAFVELNDNGERHFSFARKPGADTCLREDEIKLGDLSQTKVFHFGSLSLTNEPSRSATITAIEVAKKAGAMISYDPNYRALLWSSKEKAREQMRSVLKYVNVLKISDEETDLLTDQKDASDASRILLESGIPLVVVTLGSEGALIRTKEGAFHVKGFKSNVVDTTGAGDSFWGGFLYQLIQSGRHPAEVTLEEGKEFVLFANAVASLCVEKRGALPAMPDLGEVKKRLMEYGL